MQNNSNLYKKRHILIYFLLGAAILGVKFFPFENVLVLTSLSRYIESSKVHRASGNYKAALKDLNRAIKLNSHPFLYIDRADVRDKLGDAPGVIEDYTKAIQIDPKNKDAYLARLIYQHNDEKVRLQQYNKAIQIGSMSPLQKEIKQ